MLLIYYRLFVWIAADDDDYRLNVPEVYGREVADEVTNFLMIFALNCFADASRRSYLSLAVGKKLLYVEVDILSLISYLCFNWIWLSLSSTTDFALGNPVFAGKITIYCYWTRRADLRSLIIVYDPNPATVVRGSHIMLIGAAIAWFPDYKSFVEIGSKLLCADFEGDRTIYIAWECLPVRKGCV